MKLIVPTSLYLFLSVVVWGIPDAWNTNTTYNKDDVVLYTPSGTSEAKNYIALQTGAGNQPDTSTAFWSLLDSVASSFSPPPGDPTTFSTPDTSSIPNETPPESNPSSPVASGHLNASNEAFVMQQYRDFFGRDADEGGLTFWTGEIDAGRKERADLAMDFVYSTEYQNNVAPVVRLYFAYFNRLPDTGGLTFWIESYNNPDNWTLFQISDYFAASDEFIATYGSLDNGPYVTLTYKNVFERDPDSGGYNFWKNELDTGNRTRGMAMVEHAESQEYKDKMSSEVQIVAYYFSLLRRAPDQGGFDYWLDRLNKGDSAKGLIADFLYSEEYQGRDFTLTH